MSIRLGINFSSLSVDRYGPGSYKGDFQYGTQKNFRPGIEVEYIFPFNKNKWGFVFEATYQKFKGTYASDDLDVSKYEFADVDYSSLDLLLGVRHYFFLNDKSRIFLTGSYVAGIPLNSSLDYKVLYRVEETLELDIRYNPSFGLGFSYNNMIFEVKYNLGTTIIDKHLNWDSNYDSYSVIVGYNLF